MSPRGRSPAWALARAVWRSLHLGNAHRAPADGKSGEVCPGNWIYHRLFIPDTDDTHYAGGVRFHVHVHEGDVYYLISRWPAGGKPRGPARGSA